MKKVIVKCLGKTDEFKIDPKVFDDIYYEAAIRFLKKGKDQASFRVSAVIECFDKNFLKIDRKHFYYNTYHVLIGAGMCGKAEMLRSKFLKEFGIDLQKEKLRDK
jgi:hypothetical protein